MSEEQPDDRMSNPVFVLYKNELDTIAKNLQVFQETNKVRMPERMFANVFFPYFADGVNPHYNVDMGMWVNYAKSPFTSVEVYDENGHTVFVVPPVLERFAFKSNAASRSTMGDVLKLAKQFANIHPSQGRAYLDAQLEKRTLLENMPEKMVEYLRVWNFIFKRYGREPLLDLDEKINTESSVDSGKFTEDDFEEL